jgi:hypothetical protein
MGQFTTHDIFAKTLQTINIFKIKSSHLKSIIFHCDVEFWWKWSTNSHNLVVSMRAYAFNDVHFILQNLGGIT